MLLKSPGYVLFLWVMLCGSVDLYEYIIISLGLCLLFLLSELCNHGNHAHLSLHPQVGDSRVSRRPHSYHQSQSRNVRSDSNTLPHASHRPPSQPPSDLHHQNSNSDVNASSRANANSGLVDNLSHAPSERSYRPSQPTDPSYHPSRPSWEESAAPQSSRSPHDNYAVPQSLRSPYDVVPESSRSPYDNSAASQHSRSSHDNKYAVPQSSRSCHENSRSYHADHEAPRSRNAASNSSYRSHRSHHRDNVNHAHPAHPRSQVCCRVDCVLSLCCQTVLC